nr:hypothetical protein [Enterobacter roggenkampii]
MSPARKPINAPVATLTNPLDGVASLTGIRVHHVGQGDALSVLDQNNQPVFHIDYGGRQSSPYKPSAQRAPLIDAALPIDAGRTLMLSHWDEDHWCAARIGTKVLSDAHWLVPRQLTSPRAVERSTRISTIHCIPERFVGTALQFETIEGDALWFEKLGAFVPGATSEDCNATGVAFAITSKNKEAILLPGDAPFHLSRHYQYLKDEGYTLRGVLAFHHGANTHWTTATEDLLRNWPPAKQGQHVVFSYGEPNAYGHPYRDKYRALLPSASTVETPNLKKTGFFDLRF